MDEIVANQFVNAIYRAKESRLERYQSGGGHVDFEIPLEDKFNE
ncbi:hypothetical protein [Olleya sp. Bg11-27]|nr:hypothetical protein [Olleya sp. Bg11-27]